MPQTRKNSLSPQRNGFSGSLTASERNRSGFLFTVCISLLFSSQNITAEEKIFATLRGSFTKTTVIGYNSVNHYFRKNHPVLRFHHHLSPPIFTLLRLYRAQIFTFLYKYRACFGQYSQKREEKFLINFSFSSALMVAIWLHMMYN